MIPFLLERSYLNLLRRKYSTKADDIQSHAWEFGKRREPMSKTAQWVTAAVFCAFLVLFGALHLVLPDRVFSPVENRNLNQLPAFSWQSLRTGTYTAELETYLEDQFPLRDDWMGLKTRWEYLLGKREFHDVFLCGDTLIGRVDEGSRWTQNLDYVDRLVEQTDLPVYFGLIPTAAEVWQDKLPDGAESADQSALLEQARGTEAVWVDIAGALAENVEEAIFYRTDHHWTSLGAYCGYTALMEALGEAPLPLGAGETVSENFLGTLYSSSGVHWVPPDTIERYVPGGNVTVEDFYAGETHGLYVDSFLEEKDQYASFLGGNTPLYIVRNPDAATGQTLLLVRDSYSDSLAPFLSQYFSEIHLLDLRYSKTPVAQYAADAGADLIFICYSVDNFSTDADAVFLAQ